MFFRKNKSDGQPEPLVQKNNPCFEEADLLKSKIAEVYQQIGITINNRQLPATFAYPYKCGLITLQW